MELPLTTISISLRLSSPSLYPKRSIDGYFKYHCRFPYKKLQLGSNSKRPRRIKSSFDKHSSSSTQILNRERALNTWEDAEIVEAIGVGSRKDVVLDFCLSSSSLSRRLRFWNIIVEETFKVQLQQRLLGDGELMLIFIDIPLLYSVVEINICLYHLLDLIFHFADITKTFVEESAAMKSHSKAVAGASYGSDLNAVHDIFEAIKLANGFVVTIILKPFRFEGQRRQNEVKDLMYKLEGFTYFCIMIDAYALLEKDLVTLDEALQIANNAVLKQTIIFSSTSPSPWPF
ncbi:hypothetical protein LXL04_015672 [Taraxacum kok-saghyz]